MRVLAYISGFFLLLLSSFLVNAQRGFHVGVGGSFNSAWIVSQNNFETLFGCSDPLIQKSELAYENTFGFTAGLALGYQWEDRWGAQGELNFNKTGQHYQDGYSTSFCPEYVDVRREVDLSYFQVPLMLKFSPGKNEKVKFSFLWGIQFGFLLTSDEAVWISNLPKQDFQVAVEDKFKSAEVGLPLRFGVDFYLSNNLYINAGLATYFGFTDLNGSAVQDFVSNNDIEYQKSHNFHAGLNVGVHYLLRQNYRRASW